MAEAYRFNGPIPEAVKQLRDRRRFRGSQLYETVKRGRRWDAEACLFTAGDGGAPMKVKNSCAGSFTAPEQCRSTPPMPL